jgi:Cell division protein FtsQ/POTRA domain, FtsQ-type
MARKLFNIRVLVPLLVVVVILVAGWFWYRGSSLVKIRHVTVTGLSGPDVNQIRTALTQEALTMTTMNLSVDKLEQSVSGYPVVSSVSATTHGSHAVTISVMERIPVATISGQVLDGGGYVLAHDTAKESLPVLKPVGGVSDDALTAGQVTGVKNLAVLKVLAGAPYQFLPHVKYATFTSAGGIVLQLRDGPELQFGGDGTVSEKWEAVLAVLRSPSSAGACEINVTDPQRPAAGTNSSAACTGSAGGGTATSSSGGSTASTTPQSTVPANTTPATTATTPSTVTTTAINPTTT